MNSFEFDRNEFDMRRLSNLNFSEQDFQALNYALQSGVHITTNNLTCLLGYDYNTARRVKYMYDIGTDKVLIECTDDLVKHLKKINTSNRTTVQDLATSKIREVPRVAVILGVPEGPFSVYNSSNDGHILSRIYKVISVGSENIIIETGRSPRLRYNDKKEIPGVIKLLEANNGKFTLEVNSKNCKLCNRFIIVASVRCPEFVIKGYSLITSDGQKIYVYAQNAGASAKAKTNSYKDRVYDWGILGSDISNKLLNARNDIYSRLGCLMYEDMMPTDEFRSGVTTISNTSLPTMSENLV